ncbi:MAG: hypothetical protein SPI87_01570 [Anaerobutyricum sp.]|nr:hypothetical protein [Eubacterium sp.]MDY6045704.1 hypothetical protein [Anaerobutyricum sp.]
MKKKNVFMIAAAIIGMFAGAYFILRAIRKYTDSELSDVDSFDADMNEDLSDDYPEEAMETPVPEEKPASTKIRRGYIPIRLHKAEASDNA